MASLGSSLIPVLDSGNHILLKNLDVSIPNSDKILLTATVPASKTWRLLRLESQSRGYGFFVVKINSVIFSKSISGPASENQDFIWQPFVSAAEGDIIEVVYTQGDGPILDVSCFLFITEI